MTPFEMKALFVGVCVVAGIALWLALSLIWSRRRKSPSSREFGNWLHIPFDVDWRHDVPSRFQPPQHPATPPDHPYDWAKREPMIWGRS